MSGYVVDASVAIKWFIPSPFLIRLVSLIAGQSGTHAACVPFPEHAEVGAVRFVENIPVADRPMEVER